MVPQLSLYYHFGPSTKIFNSNVLKFFILYQNRPSVTDFVTFDHAMATWLSFEGYMRLFEKPYRRVWLKWSLNYCSSIILFHQLKLSFEQSFHFFFFWYQDGPIVKVRQFYCYLFLYLSYFKNFNYFKQ